MRRRMGGFISGKYRALLIEWNIMAANYGISPPSAKYFDVISEGYKNCSLDLNFLFEAKKYSIRADSGEGYKSARWDQ